MATILQLPSGRWRVQVRRKPSYASETFPRHEDARTWATATERRIDLGEAPLKRAKVDPTTFAHLIDLHVQDRREVGMDCAGDPGHCAFSPEKRKAGHARLHEKPMQPPASIVSRSYRMRLAE